MAGYPRSPGLLGLAPTGEQSAGLLGLAYDPRFVHRAQQIVPQGYDAATEQMMREQLRGLLWGAASMAPVTGQAIAAKEGYDALREGDWAGLGLAAFGMLPNGKAAQKIFRIAIPHGTKPFSQIVRNPTQEMERLLLDTSKYKALREMVDADTGERYVWDAADLTHAGVADELGVARPHYEGEGWFGLDENK